MGAPAQSRAADTGWLCLQASGASAGLKQLHRPLCLPRGQVSLPQEGAEPLSPRTEARQLRSLSRTLPPLPRREQAGVGGARVEWHPRHGRQWHPGPDALYTVTWLSGSLIMPSAGRTPVCPSAHGRLIPQRSPCCHSVGHALWSDSGSILTPHHGPLPTLHSPATSCPRTRATSGPPTGSVPLSGRLSCPHRPQAWHQFPLFLLSSHGHWPQAQATGADRSDISPLLGSWPWGDRGQACTQPS